MNAVIFVMDGVLVDSERVVWESFRYAGEKTGVPGGDRARRRGRAEYLCAGAQTGERADAGEETGDGSGAGRAHPSRADAVRRAEAARARGGYRLARRRDGSLYTVYKNQPYRAIPMAAWGLPTERMVEKRTIHGVEYAVFALKDGRIL